MIGTMRSWRAAEGASHLEAVGMLICTVATMRSSTVHEYYQLPFLLFSSPLVGLGWQTLAVQTTTLDDSNVAQHHINRQPFNALI